jgi:hypothetical protein
MSRCLAILAACIMALAPLSGALAQTAPAPTSSVTEAERTVLRDGISQSGGGPTFGLVREHFGDEYLAFETETILAIKGGQLSPLEIQQRTFTFMRGIRDRVMPNLKRAPTPDLIRFAEGQRALMKALLPVYPRLCYEYVEFGGPGMETSANMPHDLTPLLNAHNALQFEIALIGGKSATTRQPVSQEDYATAFAEFGERHGDTAWLQATASGKPRPQTDAQRCQAAIIWIDSILSLPAEQAARLLAG